MARPCALSAGARSDQGASDSPLPVRRPGRPSTPEGLGERLLDGWRDGYGDGGEEGGGAGAGAQPPSLRRNPGTTRANLSTTLPPVSFPGRNAALASAALASPRCNPAVPSSSDSPFVVRSFQSDGDVTPPLHQEV